MIKLNQHQQTLQKMMRKQQILTHQPKKMIKQQQKMRHPLTIKKHLMMSSQMIHKISRLQNEIELSK